MINMAAPIAHDEYDSPWKQLIEWYFEPFMRFFFPAAHAQIDWQRSVQFSDKELHLLNSQVARLWGALGRVGSR